MFDGNPVSPPDSIADREALRWINDAALPGPENMARDETLLTMVGDASSPPTLRLYRWSEPTISLGYFQRIDDFKAVGGAEGELTVVRRQTGGGAILHDLELTYSLVLPSDHRLIAGRPNHLYEAAHDAVIAVMQQLGIDAGRCGVTDDSGAARGPFFCFERRHCYDVLVDGEKLAGSAQRRTPQTVLQHGSIILGNRFEQQPVPKLARPFDELIVEVSHGFPRQLERVLDVRVREGEWTPGENQLAGSLEQKYAGQDWTSKS